MSKRAETTEPRQQEWKVGGRIGSQCFHGLQRVARVKMEERLAHERMLLLRHEFPFGVTFKRVIENLMDIEKLLNIVFVIVGRVNHEFDSASMISGKITFGTTCQNSSSLNEMPL